MVARKANATRRARKFLSSPYTQGRRYLSLAVITCLGSACEQAADDGLNDEPLPAMVLSKEPVASIGATEGRESDQLFRVVGGLRRGDGGIVVANAGTNEIRFFDSNGSFLRSVGRGGAGPGEFRSMRSIIKIAGDSVLVWDPPLNRLTLLGPSGDVRDLIQLNAGLQIELNGETVPAFPTAFHALRGGALVGELGFPTQVMTRGATGIRRDTVPLPVFDRTGRLVTLLGPFAGADAFVKDRSSMPMPYGHRLLVATTGRNVFIGTGKGPIHLVTPEGDTLDSLTVPLPRIAVSDDAFAAMKESWIGRIAPAGRAGMRDMLAEMPRLEYRPLYSQIRSSADGDLWIREFAEPTDSLQRWVALDPSGTARFEVEFNRTFELLDSGRDFVIMLVRDEFDTEQIRLYRLRPEA